MAVQENPFPLRIDPSLMKKVRVLAKENGRSINKEIEIEIKRYITDYEREHGLIKISEKNCE